MIDHSDILSERGARSQGKSDWVQRISQFLRDDTRTPDFKRWRSSLLHWAKIMTGPHHHYLGAADVAEVSRKWAHVGLEVLLLVGGTWK